MDQSINRRQGNIFSSRASPSSTAKNVYALGVVRLIMSRISPLPCPSLVPSSSNELVIIFDCLPISVHVNHHPPNDQQTNQTTTHLTDIFVLLHPHHRPPDSWAKFPFPQKCPSVTGHAKDAGHKALHRLLCLRLGDPHYPDDIRPLGGQVHVAPLGLPAEHGDEELLVCKWVSPGTVLQWLIDSVSL